MDIQHYKDINVQFPGLCRKNNLQNKQSVLP